MRRWKLVAAAIGVLVPIAGLAAPAGAALAVTVTPNSNLADGQVINVSASGFASGAQLAIIECESGAIDANGCDLNTLDIESADGSGALNTSYTVSRLIFPSDAGPSGLDCATAVCNLAVADLSDTTIHAGQQITFNPNTPVQPPLVITAQVTGAQFDQAGNVTITGVLNCNQLSDTYVDAFISQRAGRAIIEGEGFNEFNCNGNTPFSVKATPYNGIFRGGDVQLQLYVNGQAGRRFFDNEFDSTIHSKGGGK